MDDALVRRLVDLNVAFYERLALPFAASRAAPQPGFERLLPHVPSTARVLDVGCGNGRFGRFLAEHDLEVDYIGVDFSVPLLTLAEAEQGRFVRRDLSRADCLAGLPTADLIVCLSTLQHIPGHANRERLVSEMAEHLTPAGRLILSSWQFLDSDRQRRKILPWTEIGIDASAVEQGDYLLSWDRGGTGLRYVSYLDGAAMRALMTTAGLTIIDHFRSDGREGNLNLYVVGGGRLTPPGAMLQSD